MIRVVIADDHSMVRGGLQQLLASMGGLLRHFRLGASPDGDPEVRPWNRTSVRRGWHTTVHK